MYEIRKPELLDPKRVDSEEHEKMSVAERRAQTELLAKALAESCEYAEQLWNQLDALRGYLLDSLPPDPRKPGPHTTAAASPSGPDDEAGWQNWINAFAGTTSALCGPHGDSGFGLSRAREEAQLRRTAPELTLHARHPELSTTAGASEATSTPQPTATPGNKVSSLSAMKTVAGVVVAVLALRGLRPRPKTRTG
jgi:hypothetical protein